jgi:hypothetical protein
MEGSTFLSKAASTQRTEFRQSNESERGPGDRCVNPKQEASDAEAKGIVFRVLSRFPEAYHAVLEALRSRSPDKGGVEKPWS